MAPLRAHEPASDPRRAGGATASERAALILGAVLLVAWTFACLWFPLTDTDVWWHLAAADWMRDHGAVPRTDPFSTSAFGKTWVDLHWGFQLLCGALWSLGGPAGLIAGKCLLAVAALLLALRPHLDARNALFLLPFAGLAVHQARHYLDMRPLAVTLVGLAGLYAVTEAHLRGRLRRPWLLLLPIQVVLANTQGLYPVGAFLVTSLAVGAWWDRRRGAAPPGVPSLRPLLLTCLGLWLAGLATPYGWQGFALPLALFARITPLPGNVFSAEIAENLPLHALARQDPRSAAAVGLLVLAALWTFDRARGRFSAGHALLFAGFALLGAMAQRNLPLLLLGALLAAGRNLQVTPAEAGGRGKRARPGEPRPGGAVARLAGPWTSPAVLVLLALLLAPGIRRAWDYELPGSLVTPFRVPERAADLLEAHPLEGRLFNELRFGGYLAWRLHPETRPFVDGRMILRDAAFYEEFLAVVDRPAGFPAYARRHGLTHALLPIGEDRRFLPLAAHLAGPEGWDILHGDGAAVLLARPGLATALALPRDFAAPDHPLRLALRARFGANPRLQALAEENLAAFLRAAGLPGATGP